jgi:hypothetical protein
MHPLRLPIYRCTLTQALVERLRTHFEGEELASYLEGTPQENLPCSVIGPDLQMTSRAACTDKCRRERCLPHFVETLTSFGLDTNVPSEL